MNFAELYGIYPADLTMNTYETDTLRIKRRLNLEILSNLINIDENILYKLNPSYKLKIIPEVEHRDYYLRLPKTYINYYLENRDYLFSRLQEEEVNISYPEYEELVKTIIYEIKKGDYLGKIANIYNCKVQDIMMWNDKKNTKIKIGERIKIYVNADYE